MFENSQDFAQKPQKNCAFMNSASELHVDLCVFVGTLSMPPQEATLLTSGISYIAAGSLHSA
jgi:hypothetical protein